MQVKETGSEEPVGRRRVLWGSVSSFERFESSEIVSASFMARRLYVEELAGREGNIYPVEVYRIILQCRYYSPRRSLETDSIEYHLDSKSRLSPRETYPNEASKTVMRLVLIT